LKQYDDAEKMIRKQIKKFPDDLSLYVDLGGVYEKKETKKPRHHNTKQPSRKITPNMPQ
jgi:hypothetical protein